MGLCISCTIPSALANIGQTKKHGGYGEIARFYFQRMRTAGVDNAITVATDDPTEVATWNALNALTTSAKVVAGPLVGAGFTIPNSEDATVEQPGGIMEIVRKNPVMAEGVFQGMSQATILKVKALECEPQAADGLGFFAVTACGNILAATDDAGLTIEPIPVRYLSVSSLSFGAGTELTKNAFKMQLDGNWSDRIIEIAPADFDALSWKL